jgi:uncharacterized protein (TIGR02271 family)
MRPTWLVRTAAVLLLFSPFGCDLQRHVRGHAQEEGRSMTGSHDTGTQGQPTSRTSTEGANTVVPIVQEELQVDTERVETGRVRLTKRVHEREVLIEQPSIQEEVQVERVPVNRFVAEPVTVRYEGDTMIIPVMEEVVIVETRLRLKEEVRVTKRQITTPRSQPVRLRTEEVQVERVPPRSDRLGKDEASQ